MAKGGFNIVGLVMMGGAVVALYEGVLIVTGMEPFIKPDPIHDFLKSLIPGGGGNGNGGCTLQCTAPQVLNSSTCTCESPGGGCTLTCTAPQVLNSTTCTCETPGSGGTASAIPNKTIYVTGDSVVVAASGFAPNEMVGSRYTSNGVLVAGGAKENQASAQGAFSVSYPFSGGGHVTLTGRTSGKTAQALVNTTASAYTRRFY